MGTKAKVWVGYCALVALSVLLLLLSAYYRSRYRSLAHLLAEQGAGLDLSEAGAALSKQVALAQVIRPAIRFGVRNWFYGLDLNVRAQLPGASSADLESEVERALATAVASAMVAKDVTEALARGGLSDEEIGETLKYWRMWLGRRERLAYLGESVKRQYQETSGQASELFYLAQAGTLLLDSEVVDKIIRPALEHGMNYELICMEADTGVQVPEEWRLQLAEDILQAISVAARYAVDGLYPQQEFAKQPDPASQLEEIEARRNMPPYQQMLRSIYEDLRRRFEEEGDEASSTPTTSLKPEQANR